MVGLSGDDVRRRTAVARVRRAAGPARRAAGRTGRRVPWPPRRRSARTARDSSNVSAATSPGSSASSRCAAVADPVIVVYTSDSAVCSGARPPALPTSPAATARCGLTARARPSRRSGHTRRASRSRPASLRPRCLRAAGDGVRASVSRSASATRQRARVYRGRDRRGHQAVGADAAAQERPQRRQVDHQPAGDGLLDTAGVHVAAGRQPGVGQASSVAVWSDRLGHQNRKYLCAIGSSVAGCSLQTSPSMRTVNVSGSTSMRGSRVVERHLGLADLADVADRRPVGG